MKEKINILRDITEKSKQELNFFEAELHKRGSYLINGDYRIKIGEDKTIAYAIDLSNKYKKWLNSISNFEAQYKLKKHGFKKNITRLIKLVYKPWKVKLNNKHKKNNFKGNAIIVTSSKSSKVIDFDERAILNIVDESSDNLRIIDRVHSIYSLQYKTTIQSVHYEKKTILENLILDSSKLEQELVGTNALDVTETIIQKQVNISIHQKDDYALTNIEQMVVNRYQRKYIRNLIHFLEQEVYWSKYEYILSMDLPIIFQHGDLLYQNVIVKNNDWYLIDFEHSKKLPFFYDTMYFILAPVWIKKWTNTDLLSLFLDGSLDRKISKMFEPFEQDMSVFFHSQFALILTTVLTRRLMIDSIENDKDVVKKLRKDIPFLKKCLVKSF